MSQSDKPKIGFCCAYTPLAVIDAAGCTPYRILPIGDCPDQAGHILHDNLCPHVKRVLDRALGSEVPDLAGMVLMNSCDAMRRLADAWLKVRPSDPVLLLELPVQVTEGSIKLFVNELARMKDTLSSWTGRPIVTEDISAAAARYNSLASSLNDLKERAVSGKLQGGYARLQETWNTVSCLPLSEGESLVRQLLHEPAAQAPTAAGVPIYLFGNVLPEPEVFSLLESWGAAVVNDDVCTGSRVFSPLGEQATDSDVLLNLARGVLSRKRCARTVDADNPGRLAQEILEDARASNARGVIGFTVKFCDPYLGRIPNIRETLREAGVPLLMVEGDCTMRSLGQQRTRVEAFVEMLG